MLKTKTVLAILVCTFVFYNTNKIIAQDACKSSATENKPVVISATQPAYPPLAAAEKVEGDVFVDVKIDPTGKVVEAAFVSGHELLKKQVMDSAIKWKFNKTENDVRLRQARLTFTFYFDADNYQESSEDELSCKYKMRIYRIYTGDCFNECDNR